MSPNQITQIVPTLTPDVSGLGDYALLLAQVLRSEFDLTTYFVLGNPEWRGDVDVDGFPVQKILQRSRAGLLAQLNSSPIVLQYEGYGYARRGYPAWLWQGLHHWQVKTASCWVTIFHEVYPYDHGPFWTSSFWLSPWQRHLAGQLVRGSHYALTSKESYRRLLLKLRRDRKTPIAALPVCSNIGEPTGLRPLRDRARRLVVFGHPNSRRLVYHRDYAALAHACQSFGITELCDIGVPMGNPIPPLPNVKVLALGILDPAQISAIMQDAIAGFISFIPPDYLAKSGVFAAYCAHGLLPILAQRGNKPMDGLLIGKHYWVSNPGHSISLATGQCIADNAHVWYFGHRLNVHAQMIAHAIR
ncbi:hypothetical protein PN441_13355 [Spirulina major CS-329]|uniref:hypothetical protein n=1 Tax=Spirulina TaxID=1154 RepID=UPI002331228B|nr:MULTISPECIES: hypothetical protein [Spirulina]MDB9495409.1 hypothetical protein [Spirulina subsalsa CS-330]MDB9504057.1 hypothetical protein [Spirulina major CS-329]